ncbi:tetratricopeptide repeat protein [Sinorhizobium sp. RAC02]|uniref:tetratricopeptide repeat protein n=1 Tax=Sinorhizobium sp. RAC02 TaxID=1842534 RepID=UPI00083DEB4D|nr:tetratricopeptide repeat protein [Sinorhizobium sp. RAC02]AOF89855.1 tetratricopeptide repeat family protein [Sinorhizobium sp. RAC02]
MQAKPDVLHFEANPESDRLLVYFGDIGSQKADFGLFARSKINKLILRDPKRTSYNGPIAGLSKNADQLAEVLQRYTSRFAPENIVVAGGFLGGYAALAFGCRLGVGKIVAFAPQFHLHPQLPYAPKMPVKHADLYKIVAARHARTDVEIWYGTEDIVDLYQALPAMDIEGVAHRPLKGCMHDVLAHMKNEGRLDCFYEYISGLSSFEWEPYDLPVLDKSRINSAVENYYIHKDDDAVVAALAPVASTYKLSAVHYALGSAYYRMGKMAEAETCFEEAIVACENNYAAWYHRGLTFLNRKAYAQAEDCFAAAITHSPSPSAARYAQLGTAQRLQGKLDLAKATHLHALSLGGGHIASHFQLGLIYQDQGLLQDALASFEQHLRLRPDADASQKRIDQLRKKIAQRMRRNAEAAKFETQPKILFNRIDGARQVTILLGFSKYMFRGFQRNNIQMKGDWYLDHVKENTEYLSQHIRRHSLSVVNIIGTSKSCTGAFIFADELARRFPKVKFNVFAFSAYTTLDKRFYDEHQLNKYLPGSLLGVWENSEKYASALARYGDSTQLAKANNISLILLYPEYSRGGETALALRMQGHANVRFVPLPVRTHSIIAPFWHKLLEGQEIEVFEGVVRPLPPQDYAYFSGLQDRSDYTFDLYHLLDDTERFLERLEAANKDYIRTLGKAPY